jgi:hypothetical protein
MKISTPVESSSESILPILQRAKLNPAACSIESQQGFHLWSVMHLKGKAKGFAAMA